MTEDSLRENTTEEPLASGEAQATASMGAIGSMSGTAYPAHRAAAVLKEQRKAKHNEPKFKQRKR